MIFSTFFKNIKMSKIHAISQEILRLHLSPAGSTKKNDTLRRLSTSTPIYLLTYFLSKKWVAQWIFMPHLKLSDQTLNKYKEGFLWHLLEQPPPADMIFQHYLRNPVFGISTPDIYSHNKTRVESDQPGFSLKLNLVLSLKLLLD